MDIQSITYVFDELYHFFHVESRAPWLNFEYFSWFNCDNKRGVMIWYSGCVHYIQFSISFLITIFDNYAINRLLFLLAIINWFCILGENCSSIDNNATFFFICGVLPQGLDKVFNLAFFSQICDSVKIKMNWAHKKASQIWIFDWWLKSLLVQLK